jgi:hypothetical protein
MVVNVTPSVPPPSKVSAKVWASTLATLAVSLLVAILTAVVNDPATLQQVLNAVPSWLRFILVAALPTLVTFLAGYVKRDTTRELGQAVEDHLTNGYSETSPEPGHEPDYIEPEGDPNAI